MYTLTLKGVNVGHFETIDEANEAKEDLLFEYNESDVKVSIS